VSDDFLPFARPDIDEADIAEVVDTLRSGWLVYGPKTQRFEAEFAALTGAKEAVAVSSCTAGMHLALLAAGIGPGDEVITSTLTFSSTANVVLHCGATPILADICSDDLNVDPAEIERRITPRTKAVMPVHYAGQACRMDEILDIARRHGLKIIEDAAHCAGSSYNGRPVGAIGDASVFSFYATKNMTTATGEGGMVTTDDTEIAAAVRLLRNQGLDANAWSRYAEAGSPFYSVLAPGFNYRMSDVQAALATGQLRRLGEFNARRAQIAARYDAGLAAIPGIETPTVRPEVGMNWHLYVIRLADDMDRDATIDALKAHGIGTAVHFLPVHMHPYYRERFGYKDGDYPVAEREFRRMISLPIYPLMRDKDVDRVVAAVRDVVGAYAS
jgi:dTDP-4-amino-4,6-dideoxygalactose transaminase